MKGSEFTSRWRAATRSEREAAAVELLKGVSRPNLVAVPCGPNSFFWASSDYASIGEDGDFVRVPLGGPNAEAVVAAWDCMLPTQKMVDLIWREASLKGITLEPLPLVPPDGNYGGSWGVFMQSADAAEKHSKLIDSKLNGEPVILSGVKKDVILSVGMRTRPGKLAFYGWHKRNGSPIQGNSFAHEATYADYSHGVRVIGRMMVVNGKEMPVAGVLADAVLCKMISDEGPFYGVSYLPKKEEPMPTNDTIKKGSQGALVKKWQQILLSEGFDLGKWKDDGDFGNLTDAATKAWQNKHNLAPTGVVTSLEWESATKYVPPNRQPTIPPPAKPEPGKYTFLQAKNYTKANRTKIDLIVIHDMEYPEKLDAAEAVAQWFASANAPQASAHYNVDADSIVQSVLDKDVAWHAPGANSNGIGIEHAGYAKQTAAEWNDAYSSGMLKLSAKLCAELCKKYGIPIVKLSGADLKAGRRGICGHVDVTAASGKPGHWDPGPNFPWDFYLRLVREETDKLEATG